MPQEIFNFYKAENLNWSDFIEGDENHDAIAYLMKWPAWNSNGIILFGGSGVGKTHLAALWAQTANAVYVLTEALNHNPRDLFNADSNFVIDNFDDFLNLSLKHHDWVFHFLNIANEKNRFFLILSRIHPISGKIELNDLKSRLRAIPAVKIKNPDDELLFKIAKKITNDLELIVSDEVLTYILNVVDRNVTSITETLRILDKLSLQEQKSITLPFVKKYLAEVVA